MATKPTHVKAVAELLEAGDFADSQDAAKAVIAKVDELREDDTGYFLISRYGGQIAQATGPFPTETQARKWCERNGMPPGNHMLVRGHTPAYRLKVRP